MNLKEIEDFWKEVSEEDFETVAVLIDKKKFMHAMFFLHLSIEKLLKGLYVNRTNAEAPFGHNLQYIAKRITTVEFNEDRMKLLARITTFNIATRYDDYKRSFYQICNGEFADEYHKKGKELIRWLQSQFQ